MKKRLIILLLTGFCIVNGFAQNAPLIKRAYAFYTESIPGMAMTDDKGNIINPKPMIERFIYVECSGTKPPVIAGVSYDKTRYTAIVSRVDEIPANIGKSQDNGRQFILIPRKGYSLWKLNLAIIDDNMPVPNKTKNITIVYRGGLHDRRSPVFHVYKETQLMVPDRY